MANIDNLNFEVILKDENFEQKIKKDLELAKQFNIELTALLDLQKKVSLGNGGGNNISKQAIDQQKLAKATADAAAAQERLRAAQNATAASAERLAAASANRAAAEARATTAVTRSVKAQKQMVTSVQGTNTVLKTQSRLLGELKTMALGYLSIRGAAQLLSSLVRITGEFELQRTALGAMLGDLSKAEQLVANIQELAVKSPFAFKELTSYAKQLAAFSVPANELFETTKMLADVSSGLGVGMDRIVLAYGQIRSAAFLRGQEVRQLTEAGIPILKELADQFSQMEGRAVSAGEVFDRISARLVPFEMVAKVFKDMTSEGGKFYEMQEIQAETLRGKVMNLKDAFEIMMNEIGSANEERLKGWVDNLRNLMQNWEKLGGILVGIVATYGAYRAVLLSIKAIRWTKALVETVRAYKMLNAALTLLNQKTIAYKDIMAAAGISMTNVWAGIAGIAVGVIAMVTRAIIKSGELDRELKKIGESAADGVNKQVGDLERLVSSLQDATQGTQEYRDIVSEINRKYKDYLPNLLTEADGYAKVAESADKAAVAIRNKAKAEAETKMRSEIEEDNRKALSNARTRLEEAFAGWSHTSGLSRSIVADILASFDTALLKEGAMDDVMETFKKVYDSYRGEGSYEEDIITSLGEEIKKYAKVQDKINYQMEKARKNLEVFFDERYSSEEERLGVEEINAWFREQDRALKEVTQTQEEYDESLKNLNITKLEKLAELYYKLSRPEIAKEYEEQAKALRNIQEGWRGDINKTLEGLGLKKNTSFGLWADEYTQSVKYVDDLVKRYKEIDDEMAKVESFDSDMTKSLQKNKDAIIAVAKTLGLDLEKLAASKRKTGSGKSQEQIDLEVQIDLVKKLQDAYEKLSPYMEGEQLKGVLTKLFPEADEKWLESYDFSSVLNALADELEKFDKDAADRLRSTVGKDVAGVIANAFKDFDKYREQMDEWFGEDFTIEGNMEIGKIVRDLHNEYAKIDKRRLEMLELLEKAEKGDAEAIAEIRKKYGEEVWKKYVTDGKNAIKELANAERKAARDAAEQKAIDKASAIVKQRLDEAGIDLTDFGDKSISQVRDLVTKLGDEIIKVKQQIAELEVDGLTEDEQIEVASLTKQLELLGQMAADTGVELDKKVGKSIEKLAKTGLKTFGDLGNEVKEFGEALGDDVITELGERISRISKMGDRLLTNISTLTKEMQNFKEGTKFSDLSEGAKGGVVGLVATVVVMAYESIKSVIMNVIQYQDALTEASFKYRDAMNELRRENYSTIFGTDEMALAAENAKILSEAMEDYNATMKRVNEVKFQGFREGVGRSGVKNQSLADMLETLSKEQGWDLYLANGEMNIDALEIYYDTFKKRLTRKQRKLVEELIENGKALDSAAEAQAEYLKDIFSGVADAIADNMIDAFVESGNAAIEMGDIMSDVARNLVSDLIQTMFIDDILNSYQDSIEAITSNTALTDEEKTSAALATLDQALRDIEGATPQIQAILEKYFEYLGAGTEEGSTDLGEGIKGITEDQANLLASYLNAIRADVSYSKTLWQSMDANLQRIADLFVNSPISLMEYQAQIAANTYNTSIATQSILSELRGIITTEDGPSAVRVVS